MPSIRLVTVYFLQIQIILYTNGSVSFVALVTFMIFNENYLFKLIYIILFICRANDHGCKHWEAVGGGVAVREMQNIQMRPVSLAKRTNSTRNNGRNDENGRFLKDAHRFEYVYPYKNCDSSNAIGCKHYLRKIPTNQVER